MFGLVLLFSLSNRNFYFCDGHRLKKIAFGEMEKIADQHKKLLTSKWLVDIIKATKQKTKGKGICMNLKEKMKQVYENQSFDGLSDLYHHIGHFILEENDVKMIVKDNIHELSSPYMFSFRPHFTKFDTIEKEILENRGIKLGENAVLIDKDSYLVNWYGKYNPQMTFLVTWDTIQNFFWSEPDYFMNVIFDGTPYIMYGDYWISRKGKNCFRPLPKDQAEHMLVKVEWEREKGTSGRNSELEESALYHHRARSKGGGIGNTYYVLSKGYVHTLSVDEI